MLRRQPCFGAGGPSSKQAHALRVDVPFGWSCEGSTRFYPMFYQVEDGMVNMGPVPYRHEGWGCYFGTWVHTHKTVISFFGFGQLNSLGSHGILAKTLPPYAMYRIVVQVADGTGRSREPPVRKVGEPLAWTKTSSHPDPS